MLKMRHSAWANSGTGTPCNTDPSPLAQEKVKQQVHHVLGAGQGTGRSMAERSGY